MYITVLCLHGVPIEGFKNDEDLDKWREEFGRWSVANSDDPYHAHPFWYNEKVLPFTNWNEFTFHEIEVAGVGECY